MDTLARLLVLGVVSVVGSETASLAAARREYGPLMFAAVPLHAPVPVLHVLTPARAPDDLDRQETAPAYRVRGRGRPRHPLPRPPLPAAPAYRDDADYEESYEYTRLEPRPYAAGSDEYEKYASSPVRAYSTSHSHLYSSYGAGEGDTAAAAYAGSAELYARPSPSGGYTYRRAVKPPVKPITKEPPYIIKIHKYRIVKDRRRRRR